MITKSSNYSNDLWYKLIIKQAGTCSFFSQLKANKFTIVNCFIFVSTHFRQIAKKDHIVSMYIHHFSFEDNQKVKILTPSYEYVR